MKIKQWGMSILLAMIFMLPASAEAFIVINEILADPPSGILGDANGDGIGSGSQDEFVELLNIGTTPLDISGWSLSDKVKERHIFSGGTVLLPDAYFVVFGGGAPSLLDVDWQTASTGSLGLNNGGDTVSLFDGSSILVDEVVYGSLGGKNQSIVRAPEGEGAEFILHSDSEGVQGGFVFSPGQGEWEKMSQPDPIPPTDSIPETNTVPEPLSILSFGLGSLVAFFYQKRMV